MYAVRRHGGYVCLVAMLAVAVPDALAAESAGNDAARRALVAQKLRLAEQLLASPRVLQIETGSDPQARSALTRARELLAQARQAGELNEVESKLNETLQLVGQAGRGRFGSPAGEDAQRQRNTELREQIVAYRGAMIATLEARRNLPQPEALATLEHHLAEAGRLGALGRHGEAGKTLDQAYRLAIESLSALRAGETVTIALQFDTPADEYAYEQKRHQSYEMLAETAVRERRPTGSALVSFESHLQGARAARARAAENAAAGDYPTAIRQLEEATRHLVRALQAAGVAGIQ